MNTQLKKQCKWYLLCPMKRYHQSRLIDPYWVHTYCWGDNGSCVRYRMEEEGRHHPDNMLPNGKIDDSLPVP